MSYILEALKKAQAERQLGSAPTIHALPLHAAGDAGVGARPRTVRIAIAATVLAVAALALVSWRQQAAAPAPPDAPPVSAAPAPGATTLAAATPAAPPAAVPGPAPAPAAHAPRPAPARPVPSPAARHAAPPAAAGKPAPVPEDLPPTLRELPDAIQHEVPQVAIGGYIYSKNPEDRLLLIDKVLRHEGEEVAPGLMLEKLLPKSAVMRYKGYRYRVPY